MQNKASKAQWRASTVDARALVVVAVLEMGGCCLARMWRLSQHAVVMSIS